jgi:hypothetical protein
MSLPARVLAPLAIALAGACSSEPPRAVPVHQRSEAVAVSSVRAAGAKPKSTAQKGDLAETAGMPSRASTLAAHDPAPLQVESYPWLANSALKLPEAKEPLEARFAPPPGFERVATSPGSFGAWLRGLPLAAEGLPVLTYRGDVLLPPDHENIAAVVAIDIGTADLQQCADSVIRLHAEWRWSQGARDMTYRAASGAMMPLARWMRGERPVEEGNALRWKPLGRPDPPEGDHRSFRKYLDSVFTWANTGALALYAKKIGVGDVRPGDFVVLPGSPGHAVLVLDMAVSPEGKRAALLGQGFMPAQSFQVLRPGRGRVWFELDAGSPGLKTPFWPTFPWDSLRRLD